MGHLLGSISLHDGGLKCTRRVLKGFSKKFCKASFKLYTGAFLVLAGVIYVPSETRRAPTSWRQASFTVRPGIEVEASNVSLLKPLYGCNRRKRMTVIEHASKNTILPHEGRT